MTGRPIYDESDEKALAEAMRDAANVFEQIPELIELSWKDGQACVDRLAKWDAPELRLLAVSLLVRLASEKKHAPGTREG